MTTTPNPTAERAAQVIYNHSETTDDGLVCMGGPDEATQCDAHMGGDQALHQAEMLHAAGLLVGDYAEEQVERAARALYDTEPIRYTLSINHEKVGESKPWDELNEATKGVYRRRVIKVLAAAGVAPQVPSAHVNPVAMSGDLVKSQADSLHVAQQEPSACEHEAWEDTGGSRRCSGCKEWLAPQEPSEPPYSPTTGQWSSYCPCIRVEQVDPECEWHGRPEFRRWVRGGER